MKTPFLLPPRCVWFRLRSLHRLETSNTLPPPLQSHLDACPDCRSAWNQRTGLETRLRDSVPAARIEPAPFLESRIVSAIRRESGALGPSRPGFHWPVQPALATLFAALALSALWLQYREPAPVPDLVAVSQPLPLPDAVARAFTTPRVGTVAQAGFDRWTQAVEQPLDLELQRVLGDARLVASSLASQFVPSGLTLPQATPHR